MQGVALITDFQSGTDMIDLSRFDADERTAPGTIKGKNTPGNEAFQLVQSTDEVTPGHLVIKPGVDAFGNPVTMVLGYTDTEPGPDIVIYLGGSPPITAADFIF